MYELAGTHEVEEGKPVSDKLYSIYGLGLAGSYQDNVTLCYYNKLCNHCEVKTYLALFDCMLSYFTGCQNF